MSSIGSEAGNEANNVGKCGETVKMGYLKKLKTMKKKYFVLRADSATSTACLEYYDSGKKWKNNHPPKRSIILKHCFSINRRTDTKHKYVIALFSGSDCFGIVLECEDDLQEWLRLLLIYQQGEDVLDCTSAKPYYEHIWRVTVQKKELACKHNLNSIYLLCLTEGTLSLVKHATDEEQETKFYEFSLQCIRRCGNLDSFFYMELGQASCLGAGNLWMQVEDSYIAHHMHSVIMNACTSFPKKEIVPKCRSRSSSANEMSRPMYFGRKWPSSGDNSLSVLTYAKSQCHQEPTITSPNSVSHSDIGRERCDSLPTRSRMTLDTLSNTRNGNISYMTSLSGRPHSMYSRGAFSPTGCSHPTSPMSVTYSTDSAGSSLSVDADSENWSEIENIRKIILEENSEDYVQWGGNQNKNFLSDSIPQNSTMCRNIRSICPHSSSNSQSSCSPCSSSPMDAGVYIPMSPESVTENRNRLQLNKSFDSINHSRESSIHEDLGEGYVPMAPLSVDAGYISMDQSGRRQGDLSSGLSSCSITSGTPSMDVRFSEFHLDKVSSYLTPDEDVIFNVRQTRAYSTGSKPDAVHNKFVRCDSADGLRVRAFSVGSRCNSNIPQTPKRTPASTSTSSIEPCDDLMEIDYSVKLRHRFVRPKVKHKLSGIVHNSSEKLMVPYNSSLSSSYSVAEGYMDMSPKSSSKVELLNESRVLSDVNLSPPRITKQFIGRSPSTNVNFSKQSFIKGSPSSGSNSLEKVLETEVQNTKYITDDNSYMDMKPGVYDMPDSASHKGTPVVVTATNLHARKESFTILDPSNLRSQIACSTLPHIKQPLLDTDGKQFKSNFAESKSDKITSDLCASTPEGYVDMSFKGRKLENQPTKVITKIPEKTPDGYVDMSFKGSRKNLVDSNSTENRCFENKIPQCFSGKENQLEFRQCSKPITIQHGKNKRIGGSGFFRRKQSEETQSIKPNFLQLGISIPTTFASLGRKKKSMQKKDKAESPISNCGSVFPLSPDRTPSLDYDPNSKCAITASGESVRLTSDFEIRSLERVDEIVNWDLKCDHDKESCDYMVMTPGVMPQPERKISEPSGRRFSINKILKSSEEMPLHRSTSVPCSMSGIQNWHRCPSSPEFKTTGTDVRYKISDLFKKSLTLDQQMDVYVDGSAACETKLNEADVPTVSTSTTVLHCSEKVTYATLDIPSSAQEEPVKEELSSNKLFGRSNLTYAQIDFEKSSSSSSSPSK